MSGLRVDLGALADLAARMQSVTDHLGRVRDEVAARAAGVNWSGGAATSYASAQSDWSRGAAEVHEALASLRVVAATAHDNYRAAVEANRRMWASGG